MFDTSFLVSSLIASTQHSHGGFSAGFFFGMIIDPLPLRSSHPCALGSPSGPGAGVSPGQAPTVAWANPGPRIFVGKVSTRADSVRLTCLCWVFSLLFATHTGLYRLRRTPADSRDVGEGHFGRSRGVPDHHHPPGPLLPLPWPTPTHTRQPHCWCVFPGPPRRYLTGRRLPRPSLCGVTNKDHNPYLYGAFPAGNGAGKGALAEGWFCGCAVFVLEECSQWLFDIRDEIFGNPRGISSTASIKINNRFTRSRGMLPLHGCTTRTSSGTPRPGRPNGHSDPFPVAAAKLMYFEKSFFLSLCEPNYLCIITKYNLRFHLQFHT